MTVPWNDEEPAATGSHVNPDPSSSKSPNLSQNGTTAPLDARWHQGVALHVVLPAHLNVVWVNRLLLSPPRRAVVLDGLDSRTWEVEAVRALAWRLSGCRVEMIHVPAALSFWLLSDLQALGRWAA